MSCLFQVQWRTGLSLGLAVVNVCASFSVHLFPPESAVTCRSGHRMKSLFLTWPQGLVAWSKYLFPLSGIAYGAQLTVFQTQTEYREGDTFFFLHQKGFWFYDKGF